jgi:hypothetical protein
LELHDLTAQLSGQRQWQGGHGRGHQGPEAGAGPPAGAASQLTAGPGCAAARRRPAALQQAHQTACACLSGACHDTHKLRLQLCHGLQGCATAQASAVRQDGPHEEPAGIQLNTPRTSCTWCRWHAKRTLVDSSAHQELKALCAHLLRANWESSFPSCGLTATLFPLVAAAAAAAAAVYAQLGCGTTAQRC